ncbi:MAG TPA: type II toxin-antitoxin system PemK/MazF family toxin [Candidatus Yonathbacteria bacterium]|nr:type II toxin-antitoxin system PemK/MazF family toxin [Candidatus Yonathbacteria bacterium]
MVKKKYTPNQGDIIFVDFSPHKGHEQKGKRPALVTSSNIFNEKTGFLLVCPITMKDNKFPLHTLLPSGISTKGFVLTEHIRSIDFKARKVFFVEKTPDDFLVEILSILESFYRQ